MVSTQSLAVVAEHQQQRIMIRTSWARLGNQCFCEAPTVMCMPRTRSGGWHDAVEVTECRHSRNCPAAGLRVS